MPDVRPNFSKLPDFYASEVMIAQLVDFGLFLDLSDAVLHQEGGLNHSKLC